MDIFDVKDAFATFVETIGHQETKNVSENKSCLFKCYYCDRFTPTSIEQDYLKHVVLTHENKPAYPSMADLIKNNLKPQGKSWES